MNVFLDFLIDAGERFAFQQSHNHKDAGRKRRTDDQLGEQFLANHGHRLARETFIKKSIPIVADKTHVNTGQGRGCCGQRQAISFKLFENINTYSCGAGRVCSIFSSRCTSGKAPRHIPRREHRCMCWWLECNGESRPDGLDDEGDS